MQFGKPENSLQSRLRCFRFILTVITRLKNNRVNRKFAQIVNVSFKK